SQTISILCKGIGSGVVGESVRVGGHIWEE
ncbi:hypothetical protein A2U01_0088960, partial [Trifolium medium]|nr:hypothetical protein [Trifolium medium]